VLIAMPRARAISKHSNDRRQVSRRRRLCSSKKLFLIAAAMRGAPGSCPRRSGAATVAEDAKGDEGDPVIALPLLVAR
jgi:hypothetical protein